MSGVKKWRALEHCDVDDTSDAVVDQEATQQSFTKQNSEEWIIIKDSEDINVTTTDIQAAASLQVGIEAALALVLRLAIGSAEEAEDIMQDFTQVTAARQSNRQKTIIEKSIDVDVTTLDTDIAINLQLLIQILLAVVASLEIL